MILLQGKDSAVSERNRRIKCELNHFLKATRNDKKALESKQRTNGDQRGLSNDRLCDTVNDQSHLT